MRAAIRLVRVSSLLLIFVCLPGCGPRYGAITGQVTFNNKPLPSGTVTFHFASGRVETAMIQPNGEYSCSRVEVGKVRVSVETPSMSRLPPALQSGDKEAINAAQRDGATVVPSVPIPPLYNNPDTSNISFEMGSGKQTFNIPLAGVNAPPKGGRGSRQPDSLPSLCRSSGEKST